MEWSRKQRETTKATLGCNQDVPLCLRLATRPHVPKVLQPLRNSNVCWDQEFKHMSLWEPFHTETLTGYICGPRGFLCLRQFLERGLCKPSSPNRQESPLLHPEGRLSTCISEYPARSLNLLLPLRKIKPKRKKSRSFRAGGVRPAEVSPGSLGFHDSCVESNEHFRVFVYVSFSWFWLFKHSGLL